MRTVIIGFILALIFGDVAIAARSNVCAGAVPEQKYNGHDLNNEQDNWYHYEHGMELIDDGDFKQAAKEFNYYIQHIDMHYRMYGAAYYGFGVMNQKMGNYEAAFICYEQAIKNDLHPTIGVADKAYLNMGSIHLKKKEYSQAIEKYKKSVEKYPNSGFGHYFLGMAYLKSGDLENADKESQEARKLGIKYTALDEGIAEARNPNPPKVVKDEESVPKTKSKKKKVAK